MASSFRHVHPTTASTPQLIVCEAGISPMAPEKPAHKPSPRSAALHGAAAPATSKPNAPVQALDDSEGSRNGPGARESKPPRQEQTADRPLIAVYAEPNSPPLVVPVDDYPTTEDHLPALIDALAVRAHGLARDQGGGLPLGVFRELVENLVHAAFAGVVITILDHGNTVRVSDRGPGIPDKDAALRPGFTSADANSKRFIRGVGSGFSVIKEALAAMDGVLEIEDNLGQGTVITVRVQPQPDTRLAPAAVPSYNLSERQLKTLLLAVELAPVGPTRVAQELGVSTSTAYRDLVSLEEAGFVTSEQTGRRSVTEVGLAYLDAVL
jgi:anti-sigma regulatory factor (Ser/Thr protein kinase)